MRPHLGLLTLPGLALGAVLLIPTSRPVTAQQMQVMQPTQAELIRGLLPSVVNITSFVADSPATAMSAASTPPDQGPEHPKMLQGSGLIIDPSGVILTNEHVISGAYDIHVTLSDGTRAPVKVLARVPSIDLALVKFEAQKPLPAVRWADSDKVQVGDPVFAIGNPLGIGLSVSSGIVSALNRNIMDTPYDDFIQTDAAINHGNSGGPLFNTGGEVIGIDTAIVSPTTGSVGLGFAIPANDAQFVAARMLRDGGFVPAYLGFKIEPVTQDIAAALDMRQPLGSIIASLHETGPAGAAGLQVGDVILTYNNQSPPDDRALLRDIAKSAIGQSVPVTVLRAGQEQTMRVTPIAWPGPKAETEGQAGQTHGPGVQVPLNLGVSLSVLTADLRAQYGLHMQQAGVLVDGVAAGTDAFDRGLAPGDVILRAQGTDVTRPAEVQAVVDAARSQHKAFILALVLPKAQQNAEPRWVALRVGAE